MTSVPMESDNAVLLQPGKLGAIALALMGALPGTQLILAPGHYLEQQLVVPALLRGVHIACEERTEEDAPAAVIELTEDAPEQTALLRVAACGAIFKNIHFKGRHTPVLGRTPSSAPARAVVYVEGFSNAVFERCTVSGGLSGFCIQSAAAPMIRASSICECNCGVVMREKATPAIEGCSLSAITSCYVRCTDRAGGRIERCRFAGNRDSAGVECFVSTGDTTTLFQDNEVHDVSGCAVLLNGRSKARILRNTFTGLHLNGILAGGDSDPTVTGNRSFGTAGSGIVIYDRSRGVYQGNEVSGSRMAGVGVRDKAAPVFNGNTIRKSKGSGLVLDGQAGGVFSWNTMSENACAGVGIKDVAHALFESNMVRDNEGYGVWLQDESRCTFQYNTMEGNVLAGISGNDSCAPMVVHNTIRDGKSQGILLSNRAGGHYTHNTVSGNRGSNVLVMGTSQSVFEHNVITGSPGGGMLFRENSCARVVSNIIERNSRANVAVLDESSPLVADNLIQDGDGRGIVITGAASGEFLRNFVASHVLAGMYVGGRAAPVVKDSVVTRSAASGLVIEDMAQGFFVSNTLSSNGCAAVAIQGSSSPAVTGNIVMHSGRGGVWMGEYAQGTVRDNFVEDGEKAWRVGKNVRADVETPVVTAAELQERIQQGALSSRCELMKRGLSPSRGARKDVVVLIQNPDEAGDDALSLGFSRCYSEPTAPGADSSFAAGKNGVRNGSPTNSDSVESFTRVPSINSESLPQVTPPSESLRIG